LIVYHFIPVLLVTKFLEAILNPARRVRVTGSAAGEGERPFTP